MAAIGNAPRQVRKTTKKPPPICGKKESGNVFLIQRSGVKSRGRSTPRRSFHDETKRKAKKSEKLTDLK